jgi:hypothetical protein
MTTAKYKGEFFARYCKLWEGELEMEMHTNHPSTLAYETIVIASNTQPQRDMMLLLPK